MRDLYDTFVNECSKAEETFRDVYTSAYTDRVNRINQALQAMVDAMSERLAALNGELVPRVPKTLKHEEQPLHRRTLREHNTEAETKEDNYREQQAEKQAAMRRLNEQDQAARAGTVGISALEDEFRREDITDL